MRLAGARGGGERALVRDPFHDLELDRFLRVARKRDGAASAVEGDAVGSKDLSCLVLHERGEGPDVLRVGGNWELFLGLGHDCLLFAYSGSADIISYISTMSMDKISTN